MNSRHFAKPFSIGIAATCFAIAGCSTTSEQSLTEQLTTAEQNARTASSSGVRADLEQYLCRAEIEAGTPMILKKTEVVELTELRTDGDEAQANVIWQYIGEQDGLVRRSTVLTYFVRETGAWKTCGRGTDKRVPDDNGRIESDEIVRSDRPVNTTGVAVPRRTDRNTSTTATTSTAPMSTPR